MTSAAPLRPSEPIQRLPIEVKPLRWGLFVLTILSAGAALFVEPLLADAVHGGGLDPIWMFIPLACFAVFFAVYALDRWFLVRRRSYPPGRAFFQIVFGVLFAMLLLPSTLDDWSRKGAFAGTAASELRLLAHPDPSVRRVTLEALGFRGPTPVRARQVAGALEDRAPAVRGAAASVLARWSGLPAEDLAALAAWARAQTAGAETGAD